MATAALPKIEFPADWSIADLQQHLGGVPAERIRLYPPPGMATVQDVNNIEVHEDRLFELIDGILVEKTMGWYEALLATLITTALNRFLEKHPLGLTLGDGGTLEVLPDMVRIPDACFISWDRFPPGELPKDTPIPPIVPDLVVEVLSRGNTTAEMQRKLHDYFEAGVRLVWYIDPRTQTAVAYTGVDQEQKIEAGGTLQGGDVVPGFELSLATLFESADRRGA